MFFLNAAWKNKNISIVFGDIGEFGISIVAVDNIKHFNQWINYAWFHNVYKNLIQSLCCRGNNVY